jgi:hypothetical protein
MCAQAAQATVPGVLDAGQGLTATFMHCEPAGHMAFVSHPIRARA